MHRELVSVDNGEAGPGSVIILEKKIHNFIAVIEVDAVLSTGPHYSYSAGN